MEDALRVQASSALKEQGLGVLILVLMEDALRVMRRELQIHLLMKS